MSGANFTEGGPKKKQNPRRPARPFIIDERPPPRLSLDWISFRSFARAGTIATAAYLAFDFGRYLAYRVGNQTVPLQPSLASVVVSTSVPLEVQCQRFTASDLVVTETAVTGDTAPYLPTQGSTPLNEEEDPLPHHVPRRSVRDRLREIRAVFGHVADRVASSIVIFSGAGEAPGEKAKSAPPKDAANLFGHVFSSASSSPDDRKLKAKPNPFAFDTLSPEQWPSEDEQKAVAEHVTEEQQRRITENRTDLWGKKVSPSSSASASAKKRTMGLVSWTSSKSESTLMKSPDFSDKAPLGMPEAAPTPPVNLPPVPYAHLDENAADGSNVAMLRRQKPDEPKDLSELPKRDGMDHKKIVPQIEDKNAASSSSSSSSASSSSSGTELRMDSPSSIDAALNRFMSIHLREHGTDDNDNDTEICVKCTDASAQGGISSRCAVDSSVICAPRHRAMLAAFALLPDPLPSHLQVATFGVGPVVLAAFVFKYFAQHLKRLDVVTDPALLAHPGVIDFGLTTRAGPIYFPQVDEEKFLVSTDKKYDLLFVSATNDRTGKRTWSRGGHLDTHYLTLVKKSLSNVGVAAFELSAHDRASADAITAVFGKRNVFFVNVPKSPSDVVALASYSLPGDRIRKRHVLHRAEDISYQFRLPYDIGAHLPMSWVVW